MASRYRYTLRITQRRMDQENTDAATEQFPVPPRMFDSLFQAAATVEEGHRLHDVLSRIHPPSSLSRQMSNQIEPTPLPAPPSPAPEPLIFDIIRISSDNVLAGQDSCPICLVEYIQGDKGVVLPCQHGYHEQCIEEWTENHPTCPICRLHLA